MKQLLVLACILAATQAFGDWKPGLSVRFGVNVFGFGTSYFITIPRTVAQAKNARWYTINDMRSSQWVQTPRPTGPMPSLILYCPSQNDRTLCALFDDTNNVAGLQISLPVDDFTNSVMDWEVQGFTKWSPPATTNGLVKDYWTQVQYFVSEESLSKSLEKRLEARKNSRTLLQEGAVWVTDFNGDLLRVSTNAEEIDNTAASGFTKQACVVLMGRHYYYDMYTNTECTCSTLLPWFPLVHSGEMIAMGFVSFGKLDEKALIKDYFERPDRAAVEMIVPDGPECLYKLAEDPGLITMHTYFIDAPWLIQCVGQ